MTNVHVEDACAACSMMEPFFSFAEPLEQIETNSTLESPKGGCYARDHRVVDERRMRCRSLVSAAQAYSKNTSAGIVQHLKILPSSAVGGHSEHGTRNCSADLLRPSIHSATGETVLAQHQRLISQIYARLELRSTIVVEVVFN